MNKKVKYLIFFIGLLLVGAIVYIALLYQQFWIYFFTLIPIMVILAIVDNKLPK